MRIESVVSGCILQSICHLQGVSLLVHLRCSQGCGTGAGEGGEGGVGGCNAASDGPLNEPLQRLPTPPTHMTGPKQAKLGQSLQQSIENIPRADPDRAELTAVTCTQGVRGSTPGPQAWPSQERGNQDASSPHLLIPVLQFGPHGPWQWYLLTFGQGPSTLYIPVSPTENFPVPGPSDANQGRRLLSRTRSFSPTSTARNRKLV